MDSVLALGAWAPFLVRPFLPALEAIFGRNTEVYVRCLRGFYTGVFLISLPIVLAGYPLQLLWFWFVPAALGLALVSLIFGWLPHHPHNGHGRYTNTRATLFPSSGWIARGHDRHIVHHMIPGIPHYRIPEVFEALRPVLESRGARIEGSGAGPNAPRVFLGTDSGRTRDIEDALALADDQSREASTSDRSPGA